MDTSIDGILYENLDYGSYILDYEGSLMFGENVKYAGAEFNRLYTRRVRLPDGKGNIAYILSDSFNGTLRMINNNHFIIPQSYKKIYYPWVLAGSFMGRKYRMNVIKERNDRVSMITMNTNLRPYPTKTIQNTVDNIFFSVSDIYVSVKRILDAYTVKKNYQEFYKELVSVIRSITPEAAEKKDKKEWNHRILIIDCDAFGFKNGAPLQDNKSNPLYLLYLAFLRSRDLSTLNVDMDMMICSKNMFLKFNPAKITDRTKLPVFKRALFKIMNTDLDAYTGALSDEEKKEIDVTATDNLVKNIVNDAVEPFTQKVSPSTKAAVSDAVERKLREKTKRVLDIDKGIKETQKKVSEELGTKDPATVRRNLFTQSLPSKEPKTLINTNPAVNPLSQKREKLFQSVVGSKYEPLGTKTGLMIDDEEDYEEDDYDSTLEDQEDDDYEAKEDIDEYENDIRSDATEILSEDEEVIEEIVDEIQENIAPLKNPKTSPVNSARDAKLREEQKKITVKESTIEEILERDASNVKIKAENKASVMHTSNQNMKDIKFTNFDKTYIDELYMKDLVACFDMLKDKDSPFYITNIDIKDTSDTMNLKETWTVKLVDENKKSHTIRVDIPKFKDDRFMFIEGTKWIILKQNFYNPLVKDTPDTVILTTNYNKVTIKRKATKSLSTIERIFSLIKKSGDSKIFTIGDSSAGNLKYISSLEYDELARRIFKFSSNGCEIFFSRDYIKEHFENKIPSDIKNTEFYIGHEKKNPILINEDTGLDRLGRTISDIIEANLSQEYQIIYNSIKTPTQSMYVEAKLAGEFIPIVVVLLVWIGLSKTLDLMGITWNFIRGSRKVPHSTSAKKYIRFADGVLEYEAKTFAELILNGLLKLKPEKMPFEMFDTEECYADYIYSQWGSFNGITELKAFYEFLVDPITRDVCKDIKLPTTAEGLMVHAVKLLSDNAYVSKASDKSYRTRSIEMIPAILYSCIATQYKMYIKKGRRIPMTLNQRCVISKLIAEKTVEAYSTLNPVVEVSKTHSISTKGYKGSNSDHSYDEEKRSYDPSSVGKLAISTSADANVGINKILVIEPTISNARGYRDQVEDVDTLKDVNIFAPSEMLTPGTARNDDPIRTAIAVKQSQHVMPVEDAAPALVSNGYDEAVQFHLSDDFVINAEEDGQVIDVNDELGFIVVKYKSGKTKAISTKPEVVKNSGGGFYISNQLTPTHVKVGEKFKKDEVLAYHDKYFRYSKMNGLRYAIGPIAKVAFMSSYNTYEDAGIITEALAERMATSIVYKIDGNFKRNNNILSMVKVGDHVNIGDPLIKFDVSTEDDELSKYLSKLSEDNAALLEEETKSEIKTDHAGKVIDIKVYTLLDPSNLSPSLGKIVQQYFDTGNNKKKYLEQFDNTEGTVKAGYMLTDSTEPLKSQYHSIKGTKGIDVKIEIHIEHRDVMGVGDKLALYGPNKQIASEVIPKGYEPYSEFRPDEEISVFTSPGTIARRMTPSVMPVAAAMKVMLELKRKIQKEIKYR